MAENKAPEGAPRRKREAPTIDLTAKDVTPAPAAPEQSAAPESESSSPAETMQTAGELPPERPASDAPETDPPVAASAAPWVNLAASGVAGGAIVAVLLTAFWYGDALPVRVAGPVDNSAQIAALQKQIQDLQNRPAPVTDTKPVDALAQRVAAMEDSLKNLLKADTNVGERLTAAENAMKALGLALTALTQRSDDAAANAAKAREQAEAAEKAVTQLRGSVQDAAKDASSAATPAQVDAITQRLATLDQASKAVRDELDKAVAGEKATRLALAATSLRAAVTSGAPFGAELNQAKALGAQDKYVTALMLFAANGLPSASALAQELRALLPQLVKSADVSASGSFLDRLQANASRLVRVTPVDAPAGDDVSAVLSRLEVEAARADIAGALADLMKLPEQTRAPAQAWIAKAKARESALAAAHDFVAETTRMLGAR